MGLTKRTAFALAATTTLLGACSTGYGGGYGMASAGYYGDPYYDDGYYGWYDNFYYPGTGYYVYDRQRRAHRWNDRQRQYWQARRAAIRDQRNIRANWNRWERRAERRRDARQHQRAERRRDYRQRQRAERRREVRQERRAAQRREVRRDRREDAPAKPAGIVVRMRAAMPAGTGARMPGATLAATGGRKRGAKFAATADRMRVATSDGTGGANGAVLGPTDRRLR